MKKISILCLLLLSALMLLVGCKADPEAINNTPEVFADEASDVLRTSAVLTGRIMAPAKASIKEYGFLVSSSSDFTSSDTQTIKCDENLKEFSAQITDLEIGGTYFYAAYATGGLDRMTSTVRAFTTPTRSGVLLSDLRMVDEKTATFSAKVSDTGGGEINAVGLCWATDNTPTTYDETVITTLNSDNTFTASLSGLEAGKTYYVRAFADSDILGDGTTQTISYSRDVLEITLEEELPEPEPEPEPIWMLSGSLQGGENEIYFVEDSERGMFVAEDVNLTLWCRFKVYNVEDRGVAYGYADQTRTTHDMVDARLPLDLNGEDIEPTHAGVFDIWFDLDGKYLYIMSDGKTPEEADDYEPKPEEIIPAQPTILWRDYDISQQYRYEENMPIIIDIMAEGGINTLTVDIDSDVLTRDELLAVGLDSHIDLVNPGDMNDALISLGFLTGENIKGKTSLSIDLSNFCAIIPLISSGDNYANFTITVSDAYAQESDETLQLLFGTNEYVPETWKIYYTSTDGNIVEPKYTTGFGANIVSNTYENGQGVILFDGPVTSIGSGAFEDCSGLTSVTIPDSVTSIGVQAFHNCESLTSVTIGNGVTLIEWDAFSGCQNLQNVYIFDLSAWCKIEFEITTIYWAILSNPLYHGAKLYLNGELVTNLVIPNDVTEIKQGAFIGCGSLTSVTIPDSVTSIALVAFYSCPSLTNVEIGNGVISIGAEAFYDCDSLTSVYCNPTTPPEGGSKMFEYNASGRKIYVPNASVDAYKSASGWSRYANYIYPKDPVVESANNEIYYTSTNGTIVKPYIATGFGANIVSNTYENGQGVITFDGPVTSIGDYAFQLCDGLASVTIPDSVTSIGSGAFSICSGLTAFYGKFASSDNRCLIVEDGTLKAFAPAGLSSYSIPDSVTSIGNSVFQDCFDLTSVTIPDSVTSIGDGAFAFCYGLTSVTIPNSVISIGKSAFPGCNNLSAFYGKYASADNRCLIMDGELKSFAPAGLTSYTIPDSVTSIDQQVFDSCSNLKSITIPNSVTSIGFFVFMNCTGLTSITIPDSVTSIVDYAFYNCTGLKSVYCKPTTPPTGSGSYMFYNNASGRKIYVPNSSVDAYKAASGWSSYASSIVGYDF